MGVSVSVASGGRVCARVCLLDRPIVRLRPASLLSLEMKYYHLDNVIFSIRDVNVTVQVGSNVHWKVQASAAGKRS